MMSNWPKFFVVAVLGVSLVACSSTGDKKEEPVEPVVEDRMMDGSGDASSSALPQEGMFQGDPLDDPAGELVNRIIYFDYDQSDISDEARATITAHANYLASRPDMRVVLEGHTDERGSREYNIGLGERRAQAVRRLILFQGVTDDQIETVSFGEERPAAEGNDESAWSQNRRVELLYQR